MQFTVAIDGPAAAGKGTISREVAARFGFAHLDTGLLYRAVAVAVLNGANAVEAVRHLTQRNLDDEFLRTPEVAAKASEVAAIPEVRSELVAFQRGFARQDGGAVLDGRDIGTVICPDADVKLFVTASAEIRAERRFLELSGKGHDVDRTSVLRDVIARDERDRARAVSPLKPAEDGTFIDTSAMSVEVAVATATDIVASVLEQKSS